MSGEHIEDLWSGRIKVSVWKNTVDDKSMYNATAVRRYQDKEGEWQDAHSFTGSDILIVAELMQKAFETCRLLENADKKVAKENKDAA